MIAIAAAVCAVVAVAGDKQKDAACRVAAEFLDVQPDELRLEEIVHYAWTDIYEFTRAGKTRLTTSIIGVAMPSNKIVWVQPPKEWTLTHGEEMLGEINDEQQALELAERFLVKHLALPATVLEEIGNAQQVRELTERFVTKHQELPTGWSLVPAHRRPSASTTTYDFRWHYCLKGVRTGGGVGVVVSRKTGRVWLFSFRFMPVHVSLSPRLTEEQAKAIAEEKLAERGLADYKGRVFAGCSLYVGYFPPNEKPYKQRQRLCWMLKFQFPVPEKHLNKDMFEETRAKLRRSPPRAEFYIDAQCGEVLKSSVNSYIYDVMYSEGQ